MNKVLLIIFILAIVGAGIGLLLGDALFAPRESAEQPGVDTEETEGVEEEEGQQIEVPELPEVGLPDIPIPDPSDTAARDEYHAIIRAIAKLTNTVEIRTGCEFSPAVFRVSHGDVLTVRNTTSQAHTIDLFGEFIIEAGEAQEFQSTDWEEEVLREINCDGELKGFLVVREEGL